MPKLIDFRSRFLPFFPNQRFRKCGGKYSPDRNALFIRQLHFLPLRWLAQKESYILGFPFNFHLLASGAESARDFSIEVLLSGNTRPCAHSPHMTSQRNHRACSWGRAAVAVTGAPGPTITHTRHEGTLIAADSFPQQGWAEGDLPGDPCMYFL